MERGLGCRSLLCLRFRKAASFFRTLQAHYLLLQGAATTGVGLGHRFPIRSVHKYKTRLYKRLINGTSGDRLVRPPTYFTNLMRTVFYALSSLGVHFRQLAIIL